MRADRHLMLGSCSGALPAVRGDPDPSASGQLTRLSAQQEAGGSSPGPGGAGFGGGDRWIRA